MLIFPKPLPKYGKKTGRDNHTSARKLDSYPGNFPTAVQCSTVQPTWQGPLHLVVLFVIKKLSPVLPRHVDRGTIRDIPVPLAAATNEEPSSVLVAVVVSDFARS